MYNITVVHMSYEHHFLITLVVCEDFIGQK